MGAYLAALIFLTSGLILGLHVKHTCVNRLPFKKLIQEMEML